MSDIDVADSVSPASSGESVRETAGRSGRRRRWPYLLLALAVVVAGALVAVGWISDDDASPSPQLANPDTWDSRVQEYVEVVEERRDLEFQHPVHVDFLSAKEFEQQVTAERDELTDADREELEHTTGLFRALGLLEGDVDLFAEMNQLHGGVNRPGMSGESFRWKDHSHGTSLEVPDRTA